MFDSLADGIVKTVNPVNNPKEKETILNRAKDELDLIGEIDKSYNYEMGLIEYNEIIKDNKM